MELYISLLLVYFAFCRRCFERFFKHVNTKENRLISKRRGGYLMDSQDLVGLDYLWRVRISLASLTRFTCRECLKNDCVIPSADHPFLERRGQSEGNAPHQGDVHQPWTASASQCPSNPRGLRSGMSSLILFAPPFQPASTALGVNLLQDCVDRLRAAYDTISALDKDRDSVQRIEQEVTRMRRVLNVLHEYVVECDDLHGEDRVFLPLFR